MFVKGSAVLASAVLALSLAAHAASGDAGLAQELTNPVADLVSIPIQMNFDRDIGAADGGTKIATNVQPVIAVGLNQDWNLTTRTMVPVVHQEDIFPGAGSQFGLRDMNISLFLSPKNPAPAGWSGVLARSFCCQPGPSRC